MVQRKMESSLSRLNHVGDVERSLEMPAWSFDIEWDSSRVADREMLNSRD